VFFSNVVWFPCFLKFPWSLGFRRVYKSHPQFFNIFSNYFSRDLGKVSKILKKYFHPSFKAQISHILDPYVFKGNFHIPNFKSHYFKLVIFFEIKKLHKMWNFLRKNPPTFYMPTIHHI
jgi:hypothetical protein